MTEPTYTCNVPVVDPAFTVHDTRREALERALELHSRLAIEGFVNGFTDDQVIGTAEKFLTFLSST